MSIRRRIRAGWAGLQLAAKLNDDEIGEGVFMYTSEGICVADDRRRIVRVNPAFATISGYPATQTLGRTFDELFSPAENADAREQMGQAVEHAGEWTGELQLLRADGVSIPVLLSVRSIRGSGRTARQRLLVVRDVSDIRLTQERLAHLGAHDPLTDLPNRSFLSESLIRIIRSCERHRHKAAVLFVDIDHFKDINETHGHGTGDELLRHIADRLRTNLRAEDMISRFGGDEFVIVLGTIKDSDQVVDVARRTLFAIREPVSIGPIRIRPSATIGAALYPESGTTAEDLLKNADAAMYAAKRNERGSYRFHDPAMNEAVHVRLAVQDRVRRGVRSGEFELFWQPIVRVDSGRIVGAEALLRWRRGGQLLSPDAFLPQVDGSHVMNEIGAWVIETTAETLALHDDVLPSSFQVSVNVSSTEISQQEFVDSVLRTARNHALEPSRICIEVTETALVRDFELARRVIAALRAEGAEVHLDDFGVGYSSLQYLREFGVDYVKLDRSFVADVPASDRAQALVRGFVDLAHGLGLGTVIEGVETADQVEFLRTIGCELMQGYHLGRPVPVDEFLAAYREHERSASPSP